MTLSPGRNEPGQFQHPVARWYIWLEALALIIAAPFLLVPDLLPIATAGALLLVGIVWLFSLYALPPTPTPFNFSLCLWGIVLVVGILVSADPAETLPKATGLILGLADWHWGVTAMTTHRAVHAFTALTLIISLGFSLMGFLSLQVMVKIPSLVEINRLRAALLPAVGGFSVHPNQLAGLICLYLPLLLSLLFAPPVGFSSRLARLLTLAATLWTVAVLVLTQSRGGWIGALAGAFVLLVLWAAFAPPSRTRAGLRWLIAVVLIGAIAVFLWIGPANIAQLWLDPPRETAVGTLTTLNFRKELWPWAARGNADFPFTGVGLGAFRAVAFRIYPLPLPLDEDIAHAHNIYMQTALDVGLPGLIIYLAILLIALVMGWRVARSDAGFRPASLGILSGLAALHVYGLADALALGSKPGLVFWMSLSLLAAMNRLARPINSTDRRD